MTLYPMPMVMMMFGSDFGWTRLSGGGLRMSKSMSGMLQFWCTSMYLARKLSCNASEQ
jgi:hypothetical protein